MKRMTKKEARQIITKLREAHPNAKGELVAENPFQLLIATMLSAQTTDKQVNRVTPALFKAYPTPEALAKAEQSEVEEYIHSIGFFRTKAKNIIHTAALLEEEFDGEVPQEISLLVTLPGVGQKTANVVASNAFGVPAIAVDTHVFRVSNRLGLSASKDVSACEEDLKRLLDRDVWSEAHHLLIFQGRYVCKARRPECDRCNLRAHCRYYEASSCVS